MLFDVELVSHASGVWFLDLWISVYPLTLVFDLTLNAVHMTENNGSN